MSNCGHPTHNGLAFITFWAHDTLFILAAPILTHHFWIKVKLKWAIGSKFSGYFKFCLAFLSLSLNSLAITLILSVISPSDGSKLSFSAGLFLHCNRFDPIKVHWVDWLLDMMDFSTQMSSSPIQFVWVSASTLFAVPSFLLLRPLAVTIKPLKMGWFLSLIISENIPKAQNDNYLKFEKIW